MGGAIAKAATSISVPFAVPMRQAEMTCRRPAREHRRLASAGAAGDEDVLTVGDGVSEEPRNLDILGFGVLVIGERRPSAFRRRPDCEREQPGGLPHPERRLVHRAGREYGGHA